MRERFTKEQTDRVFNVVTVNGCREMEEDRFHQAVNEVVEIGDDVIDANDTDSNEIRIMLGNWLFDKPISELDELGNLGWERADGWRQYFALDWNPLVREDQIKELEMKLINELGVKHDYIDLQKKVFYGYSDKVGKIGVDLIAYWGRKRNEAKKAYCIVAGKSEIDIITGYVFEHKK
jgi:hypothetical protein